MMIRILLLLVIVGCRPSVTDKKILKITKRCVEDSTYYAEGVEYGKNDRTGTYGEHFGMHLHSKCKKFRIDTTYE